MKKNIMLTLLTIIILTTFITFTAEASMYFGYPGSFETEHISLTITPERIMNPGSESSPGVDYDQIRFTIQPKEDIKLLDATISFTSSSDKNQKDLDLAEQLLYGSSDESQNIAPGEEVKFKEGIMVSENMRYAFYLDYTVKLKFRKIKKRYLVKIILNGNGVWGDGTLEVTSKKIK